MSTTTAAHPSVAEIVLAETKTLRAELLRHDMYHSIQTVADLKIFMQHHVFAVYDFMWLLKRLQQEICGCQLPWLPPADPQLARFVNEIVLGEESDEDGAGSFSSHFDIYLTAMDDVQSSTTSINHFIGKLKQGASVSVALEELPIAPSMKSFVEFNHRLASIGSASEVAAAFCFGREDIIPDMFERLLVGFDASDVHVPRLKHYIERHIELDGDHHGPLSHAMVNSLCGTSDLAIQQAIETAKKSISNRIALWDGVMTELRSR